MGGESSMYGWLENFIEGLVGKPEGKFPLGGLKRRRENIIQTDFQEVRCSVIPCFVVRANSGVKQRSVLTLNLPTTTIVAQPFNII